MSLARGWAMIAAGLSLAACATAPPRADVSRTYADHLIGRMANLRQDHDVAAARFFAALQRDPRNPVLLDGAASASLASGDIAGARRAARETSVTDAPALLHLIRATDAMVAGRYGQASDELGRVEGRAAQNLTARMMLVWARAAEGGVDSAVSDLAPLASIRTYGALFSYQQAMTLDFAGRPQEALAAYGEAARGGMFLPPAIERHADLVARTNGAAEAVALLRTDANQINPALAASLARAERGEAVALSSLSPARGAAIGLYGLAALFLQENDTTSALETLTLTLMLDPALDASRMVFAQAQSELDHYEAARRMLADIPVTSPYSSSARVAEAWVMFDQGGVEQALTSVSAAARAGDIRARRAQADMYRTLERYEEAETAYSGLIELQPIEWRLHFARGAARERLGRWPEAEADFRHALSLSPDQPEVMNYLAYGWVDRGEHLDEALAMLRRAVELRPSSGAIIDSLGWAYFRLGDFSQALLFIERAVELEPADATLNDHLGDVYWRLGRRIEARFQWRRALSLDPEAPGVIQAKIESGLPEAPPTQSARR